MPSVLFICTGNIIRSPFAEQLFRNLLEESANELVDWNIASSGTWAEGGHPVDKQVRKLADHWSVNLEAHRSMPISLELLERSNLVLTMESGQKEAIRYEFKDQASKVIMLSELTGKKVDIKDPIGSNSMGISQVLGEINDLIRENFDEICSLAVQIKK